MSSDADLTAAWHWNLWSPNDKQWYDKVLELGQAAENAVELPDPVIPFKIHQVWLGDRDIPIECQRMMKTWSSNHPDWEYRLWTDADAEIILQDSPLAAAFARAENPAERSDLLRLEIILQHGGLYVDVDFECLLPFNVMHQRFSFYTGVSNVGAFELNNGLFAASPDHPLVRFLHSHVTTPWPAWGQQDVDSREAVAYQLEQSGMLGMSLAASSELGKAAFLATTGPGFFTRGIMRALTAEALPHIAAPVHICMPDVFYPLPNSLRELPHAERIANATASSLAMHHWCRTWASCRGGLGDGEENPSPVVAA